MGENIPLRLRPNALWVVDANHSMSDALVWVDELMPKTVKATSVDGLIKACAHNVIQNSRAIEFLAVFGHGTEGYQSIGAGKKYESTGKTSLNFKSVTRPGTSQLVGDAEKNLRGLNGLLAPEATIFLAGCNVGEGSRGDGLLTTISGILNDRPVQAFENKTFWWLPAMAGFLKEATGSRVSSSFTILSF